MYLTLISTKRELFKGDGAETVLQMEMRVQFTLKLRVPLSFVIATRMEASTFPNGNPLISSGNPGTSISSPFFTLADQSNPSFGTDMVTSALMGSSHVSKFTVTVISSRLKGIEHVIWSQL